MAPCTARALLSLAALAHLIAAAPPTVGPYPVTNANFVARALDGSDPTIWVHYPVCNASCPKFPLISYVHGADGGDIDLLGYAHHFEQLASHGFIVAAPDSCSVGCTDKSRGAPWTDCATGLASDGLWGPWFGEQLKTIDFMRNNSLRNASAPDFFRAIDWAAGVGIAGHSMGGQASTVSAGAACAAQWDIRAAALIHPAAGSLPGGSNSGAGMSVPTAAFTSTGDHLCSPASVAATMQAFNASAAGQALPSLYRNVQGWSHLEPVMGAFFENPLLATFTAAWFKVFLNKEAKGSEYYDLIFSGSPDSICRAEAMEECYVLPNGAGAARGGAVQMQE